MRVLLLILGGLCLLALFPASGEAADAGACSVRQAQRDVAQAKRAYVRATVRLREARHVLSATREHVRLYGQGVGRWTRLSRRVGWPWPQFPTLMYVINRESRGLPAAQSPTSGAAGLLQFMPFHWQGKWDPYDPRVNLRNGLLLWRGSGWSPWSL